MRGFSRGLLPYETLSLIKGALSRALILDVIKGNPFRKNVEIF